MNTSKKLKVSEIERHFQLLKIYYFSFFALANNKTALR
jgi:hypothetical protein